LGSDIHSVLKQDGLHEYPIAQATEPIDPLQRITIVRHLESKYNEYKELVRESDLYRCFMQEEDPVKKKNYSLDLLADFKQNV
jgi:hypothetical protein